MYGHTRDVRFTFFCDMRFMFFRDMRFIFSSIPAYPKSAPKTKRMQENIHDEIALNPFTFGEFVVVVLNILINTKNKVTSNVIRPGTTSGSMRKLT